GILAPGLKAAGAGLMAKLARPARAVTAGLVLAGLGFVDLDGATVEGTLMQGAYRFLGGSVTGHFNKAKAFGLPRKLVHDDAGAGDLTELRKRLLQFLFRQVVGQISDINVH